MTRIIKSPRWCAFGLLAFILASCYSANHRDQVVRPVGQQLVKVVASGRVASVPWQIEVVRESEGLCLQAIASRRAISKACRWSTDDRLVVNFEVIGNDKFLLVQGIVRPEVAVLELRHTASGNKEKIALVAAEGSNEVRFFGFALEQKNSTDVEVHGFDLHGNQVYLDASKIKGGGSERTVSRQNPQRRGPTVFDRPGHVIRNEQQHVHDTSKALVSAATGADVAAMSPETV